MNFIIIIVFLIASLIISKQWADKGVSAVGKMNKWALGLAGGATIGVGAKVGRETIGRAGAMLGDNDWLKKKAADSNAAGRMASRLALATGRKTAKQSFDLRGTAVGGVLEAGKAGNKGGFEQTLKDKRKKEKDFADSLKPSDTIVAEAERKLERAEKGTDEWETARAEVDRLKGVEEKEAIKRVQDRARAAGHEYTREEALAEINIDRDRFVKKSLGDQRKEKRVERLEESPTFLAAQAVENTVGKIPVIGGLGTGLANAIKIKNRAAIAEIRKGKKSVKEELEKLMKESGDIPKDEDKGEDTAKGEEEAAS